MGVSIATLFLGCLSSLLVRCASGGIVMPTEQDRAASSKTEPCVSCAKNVGAKQLRTECLRSAFRPRPKWTGGGNSHAPFDGSRSYKTRAVLKKNLRDSLPNPEAGPCRQPGVVSRPVRNRVTGTRAVETSGVHPAIRTSNAELRATRRCERIMALKPSKCWPSAGPQVRSGSLLLKRVYRLRQASHLATALMALK